MEARLEAMVQDILHLMEERLEADTVPLRITVVLQDQVMVRQVVAIRKNKSEVRTLGNYLHLSHITPTLGVHRMVQQLPS